VPSGPRANGETPDRRCTRLGLDLLVEQLPLDVAALQLLVLVLAVDLDEAAPDFGQLADGRTAAVDPCPRTACPWNDTAQDQQITVVHGLIDEPGAGFRVLIIQLEGGRKFGGVPSFGNHAGIGAVAEEQAERVDQDGLAGSGFAGNGGEAGLEFQLLCLDDGEVAD